MKYVSVDLETTGLNPETCQVLEIGAVAQELGGDELGRFHIILMYDELHGSPFALNMNQRLLKDMTKEGHTPEYDWDDFYEWLRKFKCGLQNPHGIIAAGKNFSGFDLPFIEAAAPQVARQFFRRVLDPAILYMKVGDEIPPSQATCLERAGLADVVTHNAVDDAAQVRDLIEYHFNINPMVDPEPSNKE
ncbi:hypothetical protein LCGC14_0874110 [marine sediment metagenome]|uniref:Exonuclease domain-containing protein n=1 Tax=marine sediment metagenome TaxID=412755 RepID=A0A0F9P3U6_9ZZZZ